MSLVLTRIAEQNTHAGPEHSFSPEAHLWGGYHVTCTLSCMAPAAHWAPGGVAAEAVFDVGARSVASDVPSLSRKLLQPEEELLSSSSSLCGPTAPSLILLFALKYHQPDLTRIITACSHVLKIWIGSICSV